MTLGCRQDVNVLHALSGKLVHSTAVGSMLTTVMLVVAGSTTLPFVCLSQCAVVVGGGACIRQYASYRDNQQNYSHCRRPGSPPEYRHVDDILPNSTNSRKLLR